MTFLDFSGLFACESTSQLVRYLYSARPLLQRMCWGAGADHGTAMAVTVGEEEEAKKAALVAEELLAAVKLTGRGNHGQTMAKP